MIVGRAAVKPGETVLIHGVGGGVGGAALEIARLAGARVLATTSGRRRRVRSRGGASWSWTTPGRTSGRPSADTPQARRGRRRRLGRRGDLVDLAARGGPGGDRHVRATPAPTRRRSCAWCSGSTSRSSARRWPTTGVPRPPADRRAGRLRPRIASDPAFSRPPPHTRSWKRDASTGKIVLVPEGSERTWPDGD